MSKNPTLNNTLEEELRIIICEQKQHIQALKSEIELLKNVVAQETKEKYNAYKKLGEKK
jgi:hypothetical protein